MLDPRIVLAVFCLYMGSLFLVAYWVERKSAGGRSPANNPVVYSLSLAVYCTAWTYYGSVGQAATSGLTFLPMYLGPTVSVFLWWVVLRKLVRLKAARRITSIADFISARYNKSQPLAALVTIMAIAGITPYIALQLKAIIVTFGVVTTPLTGDLTTDGIAASWIRSHVGPIAAVLLILFTIVLGVRRQDPTERHEGMVMALAVECIVKMVALLVAGAFVTYFMYDGFSDILGRMSASPFRNLLTFGGDGTSYFTWTVYLILSMSAILFLPRQFHVAVVENHDEKHILTAMWLLPLYLLLVSLFVIPIAVAGLLEGFPVDDADTFVLRLPLQQGNPWLSLLVFIGGFSAAAGMVMVSSVTMATMITNHLLLPLLGWSRRLAFLKRHLLKFRWAAVAGFIFIGYLFEDQVGESYMLVHIGLISFAAVLQFAPSILGGIFWRRGNKAGALLALMGGFAVWCYTLMLPSFVRSGWLPDSLIDRGPWGIAFLKPEQLFGLEGLNPLGHAVFWTMLVNIGLYVLGSLYFRESEEERSLAEEFVGILAPSSPHPRPRPRAAYIALGAKQKEIEHLLSQYFVEPEAATLALRCLQEAGIDEREYSISIVQLVELHDAVEKCLAGSIGAAAAHKALRDGTIFTPREARELSEVYGEILAHLMVTPTELTRRIDYYQEREQLLTQQARELGEKVKELEAEIIKRKRAQDALRESEERYRRLVETMNEGLEIEDEKGIITYVNDRLCQMWGASRENIVGRSAGEFINGSPWENIRQQMRKLNMGETVTYETTWPDSAGRKISAILSSVPMLSADGLYRGCFTVVTDISHLKALEREKANMISMFAHDMRSSLTGIHGLGLRLLTKSPSMDEEKQKEYIRIINKEASKLESLVDDFLDFSRLETGKLKMNFRAISLDKELLELFEAYQVKASQKELRLNLYIEDALPIIEADVNRLHRVFTNLLDNALKFSKVKGTIAIIAKEVSKEVIIRIIDDGIGIDPRELPYIFDLFHRGGSGEKQEGYGIGLATVKAIVEGHGGRIHVASELGKGSVFSVFLPRGKNPVDA